MNVYMVVTIVKSIKKQAHITITLAQHTIQVVRQLIIQATLVALVVLAAQVAQALTMMDMILSTLMMIMTGRDTITTAITQMA